MGGIKAKLVAAQARGLRRVLIPRPNLADLDDLPSSVRDELEVTPVDHMEDVLVEALLSAKNGPEAPMPRNRQPAIAVA